MFFLLFFFAFFLMYVQLCLNSENNFIPFIIFFSACNLYALIVLLCVCFLLLFHLVVQ